MKIVSFFSGAGGLDLGFEQAGYDVVWANEFDKHIWDTYRLNHPQTYLNTQSITELAPADIPDCDGIIGGPPCQSWSVFGLRKGIDDPRGQLFYTYIDIIKAKQPKFFIAENVPGIINSRNISVFREFLHLFSEIGYKVQYKLLNAWEYGVPQTRKRVIIVGIRNDIPFNYVYPEPIPEEKRLNQRDALGDLTVAFPSNYAIHSYPIDNLEYPSPFRCGSFFYHSPRVRPWDMPAFTVPANWASITLHPSSPMMREKKEYAEHAGEYRQFSVRECARLQTFPDSFRFLYRRIAWGYHMVGNAVPPRLAYHIAKSLLPIGE